METEASAGEPLLAIYLRLDFSVAAELMLQLDELDAASPSEPARHDVDAARRRSWRVRPALSRSHARPLEAKCSGRRWCARSTSAC